MAQLYPVEVRLTRKWSAPSIKHARYGGSLAEMVARGSFNTVSGTASCHYSMQECWSFPRPRTLNSCGTTAKWRHGSRPPAPPRSSPRPASVLLFFSLGDGLLRCRRGRLLRAGFQAILGMRQLFAATFRRRGPASLVYFGADANMVESFLRNGPFLVEVAVVPPAIHVVADKPSHGRPRHDIAGKVLPRAHASHHHGGSEGIGQNRNDPRVRILVGDHRGQGPRIDGASRRKPGVPPAVGAVPKVAFTVAFERPRAVGRQFDCFHNKGASDQSFECQQAGFAQPFLVRAGSDEIEPGADRDQGVRGAGERRPLADRNLTRRVGKLFHRPLIGGEERRGGGSEDGPEFHILFAGVERTGPDGLLVLKNVLWHAQKWMENPRSFPQVLLL